MTGKPAITLDLAPSLEATLFDEELLARLASLGTLTRTVPGGDTARRQQADILVTGWGSSPLPAARADAGRVRFIAHSAGSVRHLVPKSLLSDGVRLTHASAGMARSVAEAALYFTLGQLRSMHHVDRAMRAAHDWEEARSPGLGRTVSGTRIGVVGASRVGRVYIELVRALGATVAVYDPYLSAEEAEQLGVSLMPLETLLRSCPVVALHAPVTDETRGMLTAERLALIPEGGILVNTARSALLDTAALTRMLREGLFSASLDVFDDEPLPADSELWDLPGVVLTPHIAGATHHSHRSQGTIVVEEIERHVQGRPLLHEVLPETYDRLA
ncbi:hydroxyacid dehydrogenase [Streptomyces albidus (ex Kaewkla and Franco 2022)]|uniref:hydroxyacid dehydrogenase n=1 Tax=Streptomyces albidus (ex Kaewkla and Franco 2022) TaxID=722709 RepID=UPI0015EE4F61|nr:hydroxyacid dehydrogenase [Streptomyces albidus (ex Kaewkla and Franco 2022)]